MKKSLLLIAGFLTLLSGLAVVPAPARAAETYALQLGQVSTYVESIKVGVTNPVAGSNYAILVGNTTDGGVTCTPDATIPNSPGQTSADGSAISMTYTPTIAPGLVYCVDVGRQDNSVSRFNVVYTFRGQTFNANNGVPVGPTNPAGNAPNANGCVSSGTSSYCMLQPLPGVGDSTGKVDFTSCTVNGVTVANGGFGCYVNSIIKIVIGLVGVLSVIMLIVGGLEVMTTTSASEKSQGKGRVLNAIFGLIIAVSAYAILNTINPNLVNLTLELPSANLSYDPNGITLSNPTAGTTVNTGDTLANICSPYTGNVDCEGNTSMCTTYGARIDADVSDKNLAQFMKANMVEESACNISAQSKQTAYGVAIGLFQQLPTTAAHFAQSCGANPSDINAAWLSNPANVDKDICIQQQFILSLENTCGTNWMNIAAAQDGGGGVCSASADCANPGDTSCIPNNPVEKWECPWNDTAHTIYNTGYSEARNAAKKMLYCVAHPGSWAK